MQDLSTLLQIFDSLQLLLSLMRQRSFIRNTPMLFQHMTGQSPPLPPPCLSVPIQTLSELLTDSFTHRPLENQVLEWMSHQLHPGQYNGFMDGRVAKELKDNAGNLFFDPNSVDPNKIHLGVIWSVDWYGSLCSLIF
jgi:hypothetical protein